MERKIMSLGRSSLVISLPSHWTKLNELKKGDVVSLAVYRDRSLVVFPGAERKKEPKEITLHVDSNEKEPLIVRRLIGCYLNGYSCINIVSNNVFSVPQRKAIRNIVTMLYMRVMVSDSRSVFIQTLMDESKASLDLAINRMHMISHSMCADAMNALKNRDTMLAKAVFSLDDDVDHFSFFILRLLRNAAQNSVLANELGVDPLDCMDHQTLVHKIEHAADYSADIARHIVMLEESKLRIPDHLLELMFNAGNEAMALYDKAVKTFSLKDVPASVEVLEGQQKIQRRDQEIASEAFMRKQENAMIVCGICSIRDNIKRIAECAADIAEIASDRAYKTPT
ncbi:MAG TPA: phosphate uptake regulator PhoU [Candidatus Bathyarchaeia archaeon]|nr:phosphate uptake regulator PhoU [Candidatus Bathyarchaeia archaeon]